MKPEKYKPRYLQKARKVKKRDPTPPGQKKKVNVKPFNNLSEVVEELKDQGQDLDENGWSSKAELEDIK